MVEPAERAVTHQGRYKRFQPKFSDKKMPDCSVINDGDFDAKVLVLIRSVVLGMGEDCWKVLVV